MAKPQTELTAKKFKAAQGIGFLGSIGSLVAIGVGVSMGPDAGVLLAAGAFLGLVAFMVLYITARVCAWWFHG